MAPLLIGLCVCALALGFGANGGLAIFFFDNFLLFSGAFNPARDFGPRLVGLILFGTQAFSGFAYFFWIPLIAPMFGGVFGATIYFFFISAHWPNKD